LTILANGLYENIKELEALALDNYHKTLSLKLLITSLKQFVTYSLIEKSNISVILSLSENDRSITYIPRSVQKNIKTLGNSARRRIFCGYGINNSSSLRFLKEECDISEIPLTKEHTPALQFSEFLPKFQKKTLILTTSQKGIRELVTHLRRNFPETTIFGQGISGGKRKILSLFQKEENAIIVGIIENWMHEASLWKEIDMLIIDKIPFSPPTDPYFLARTVGMKNNFEEYSIPLAIATINTLLGRVKIMNPECQLYCQDIRIKKSIWGEKIWEALG
jgi:hypothetical protein